MKTSYLLFALLFLFSCVAKDSSLRKLDESSEKDFTIFYNNDQFGYLEPCGCRITPIGGLHRRFNAIQKVANEKRIQLEAGNLFFKSASAPKYLQAQWLEQAKGLVEAYNLMGVSAATIGDTDLALGLDTFIELKKLAKFPFLAANVIRKNTNQLFLPASTVIENQGRKIGVFGLVHPSLKLTDELRIEDPIAAAKREIDLLKKQGAEMIVALTQQGYDNDKVLAEQVAGIDLIVGGNSQSFLQSPDFVNKTNIVQLSSQGQILGAVKYRWEKDAAVFVEQDVRELDSNYDVVSVGIENPIKNLIAVTNIRIGEANRKLDEELALTHKAQNSKYQTFLSCRECHGKQAKFQEGRPHAAAFLTLVAKQKEKNMDCLKCHSIGLGEKQGFSGLQYALQTADHRFVPYEKILTEAHLNKIVGSNVSYRKDSVRLRDDVSRWIAAMKKAEITKSFVSVQCEHCHGARPEHPFGKTAKSVVATKLCLSCHTQEQSPAWYTAKGSVSQSEVKTALRSVACPR